VKVNEVHFSQCLGAPIVNVTIYGELIIGFKVDYGSSVNLMSMEIKEGKK
jgi:hypothetical protein